MYLFDVVWPRVQRLTQWCLVPIRRRDVIRSMEEKLELESYWESKNCPNTAADFRMKVEQCKADLARLDEIEQQGPWGPGPVKRKHRK